MINLPLLRAGQPYTSLDTIEVSHVATDEPLVSVSQANRGLIARDLLSMDKNRKALQACSVAELLAICKKAAELFSNAELPLGDHTQTPDDYYCCYCDRYCNCHCDYDHHLHYYYCYCYHYYY